MKDFEEVLAGHPLFRDLAPEHLQVLLSCACMSTLNEGEYLFREGDGSSRFYAVIDGRVALELHVPGRGPVVLQTLGAGELIGWSWLVPPFRKQFDARAVQKCRLVQVEGDKVRTECQRDSNLGYALLSRVSQVMSQRLQATLLQLVDMYGRE